MRLRGLFNSKTTLVFIIVALCFHFLYRYRANVDAIKPGNPAPNFAMQTLNGKKFSLYDFKIPVMLVFLNTKTFLSSSIYPDLILRRMPELKRLEKTTDAALIVLLDTDQTPAAVKDKLRSKKYKILENSVYLSNIKQVAKQYGMSSWPNFFLIDSSHTVRYETKVPSIDKLEAFLKGS